jgi:Ca2+-binding RTX toxin-like protein
VVAGSAGNDLLDLSRGDDDSASGGAGNDVFFYGGALTGADLNHGGEGTDTLVLQGDYPSLVLAAGSLVGIEGLSLQGGAVTRWGQDGTGSYDYALRVDEANTSPGQQLRVNGQSLGAGEDFTFDGSRETDGGRFLLYAGFGHDRLTGGAGNDIFFFEAGRFGSGDRIDGGGGNDAVVISGAPAGEAMLAVTIAAGNLEGIEALSVNGRFASDPSARPSYALTIENGNIADGARLIVNGSSLGATQSLRIDGSSVADGWLNLIGGAGADELCGGVNADTIFAGGSADLLDGGGGADLFQYRAKTDSAVGAADEILAFEIGSDRIDLSQIDAMESAAGDQAFSFVGPDGFSGIAGELRAAFDAGTGHWTIEGDIDGDMVADFQILVTATTGQAIGAADFLL